MLPLDTFYLNLICARKTLASLKNQEHLILRCKLYRYRFMVYQQIVRLHTIDGRHSLFSIKGTPLQNYNHSSLLKVAINGKWQLVISINKSENIIY